MKIGNLGTRTAKLYIRNSVIFVIAMAAWWAVATLANTSGFGKITFWVSLPFWLIGALSVLGIYSIGPLGKDIKEAVMNDEAENNETLKSKKPWE